MGKAWLGHAFRNETAALNSSVVARPGVAMRKILYNNADLQYFGYVELGDQPQTLRAVFDTGSFELMVFSRTCKTCGTVVAYNEKASTTFKSGSLAQVHTYGSGMCNAKDGFDTITIGNIIAQRQPLWLATDCKMKLLDAGAFDAIVGIGPPGEPVAYAQRGVKELQERANRYKQQGRQVPRSVQRSKVQAERNFNAALAKPSILENLGVTSFSTCLGKAPGTPGWLIWNDPVRKGQPGVHKIPVRNNVTWEVQVWSMALHPTPFSQVNLDIGCMGGCGAVVDTGTSFFGVPTDIYDRITAIIKANGMADCSNLRSFPDLVMTLEGRRLRFPPSSYLGSFTGQMARRAQPYMRRSVLNTTAPKRPCELLLMDLGSARQTALGPMLILGMPFFREYYTTFHLGAGPSSRSLFVSEADENCKPSVGVSAKRSASSHAYALRELDASKIRAPHWLDSPGPAL